jgi:hypothetical protein
MTTLTITQAQSNADAIRGVGVDPVIMYDWNLKSLFPAAVAGDVIETPAFDLNAMAPKCNRLTAQKLMAVTSADTLRLMVSADGANWYTSPLYNGGTGGGVAVTNPNTTDVALAGLAASLRFAKAQLTLAGPMSAQSASRLGLTFMRI